MAAARKGHELGASDPSDELGARVGRNLIVVTVKHQHWTAYFAIHRLADIEFRRDPACLHGLDEHRAGGVLRPLDAVLDLLGRMKLGEDIRYEILCEIRIVRKPVNALTFVPVLEPVRFGHEMLRGHIREARPDARGCPSQNRGLDAFGMVSRDYRGEQRAEGKTE